MRCCIAAGVVILISFATISQAQPWAVAVEQYNNTNAGPPYNNPTSALGDADGIYVSLGQFGGVDLMLGQPVLDLPGADLRVVDENRFANAIPDESADVFLAFSAGGPWTGIGAVQIGVGSSYYFDISGFRVEGAQFVRVQDTSGLDFGGPFRGFDLDAVLILPEPSIALLLSVYATLLLRRQRS
jgi:hypothetical protein